MSKEPRVFKVLDKMAQDTIEALPELLADSEGYAKASEELKEAHNTFRPSGEVEDAYLKLEAADNWVNTLEMVAVYRRGFLHGLQLGMKASEQG